MIRPAQPQDLPAIAAIYEAILAQEDARPVSFTNWQRGKYPTEDTARAALEAGTLFTAEENGEVYGCVNLNGEQLPEYAISPGSTPPRTMRWESSTPWSFTPPGRERERPGSWWPSAKRTAASRASGSSVWTPT